MTKFADFKGTPFVPFVLTVIPKGEPLAPESKLTPEKLGKIPGVYDVDTKTWSGFNWNKPTYNRDGTLDVYDSWYVERGRPCSTIALQGPDMVAIDGDVLDNPEVAAVVRGVALRTLGPAPIRVRAGSTKFLMCYRRDPNAPPIHKRRLVVEHRFKAMIDPNKHAIEVLSTGQQWLYSGEHPDGSFYEWEKLFGVIEYSPLSVGWEGLTKVTGEQVGQFLVELEQELAAIGYDRAAKGSMLGSGTGGTRHAIADHPDYCKDQEMLGNALRAIPVDCDDLGTYDEWIRLVAALKGASRGSEEFWTNHIEPWLNPEFADVAREKWESVSESELGWDFVSNLAHKHGFTDHLAFAPLPPDPAQEAKAAALALQPTAIRVGASGDTHSRLIEEYVQRHGYVTAYVPEDKIWRHCVDGVWEEDHNSLNHIRDFCCEVGQAFINAAQNVKDMDRGRALQNVPTAEAVQRGVKAPSARDQAEKDLRHAPLPDCGAGRLYRRERSAA
jgi:hypothetical protein